MVSTCSGSYLYQSHQPLLVRNISESVCCHPEGKFVCNYVVIFKSQRYIKCMQYGGEISNL